MACSTKYSTSDNGLVVVPTQGSAVMQSFSLDLGNGHLSQIINWMVRPLPECQPPWFSIRRLHFAYVIVQQNAALSGSVTGIATFQ